MADPSGETTTTTYYPGGKPDVVTTLAGSTTDTYDANGGLTSTTYSGTASGYSTPPNVSNTYNVDGTKATMTDGTGTTTYSYDFGGDVTQQALVAGSGTGLSNATTSYIYFSTGDLENVVYPSYGSYSNPTVTYSYDATGTMSSETDWLGNAVSFAHDADGNQTAQDNVASTTNPSGTSSTSFAYDAADHNTQASSTLAQTCGGTETLTQSFAPSSSGTGGSRNSDGQVTQDSESYANSCSSQLSYERNYSYDAAGRVIYQGTTGQGASSPNIAYDASGDPATISSHDSSGNFDTYTQSFDAAGEVTAQTPVSGSSGASSTFTYDTLGDQTSDSSGSATSTYGFNQIGQMVSFNPGTTTTTIYTYTGDGLEASSEPSTATSPNQLIWNSNGSLATLLSDETNDYIYGPSDTPIEQVNITSSPPTSNPQFMTYTDSDASWIMTNTSGNETAFWRYDAFGNLAFGMPGSPFGYAGQYDDTSPNSTGFNDMRARWYDPQTGSFTTRDSDFSDTDQAYAYAGDDPVNGSDPTGRCSFACVKYDYLGKTCWPLAVGLYVAGRVCVSVQIAIHPTVLPWTTGHVVRNGYVSFHSNAWAMRRIGVEDLVLNEDGHLNQSTGQQAQAPQAYNYGWIETGANTDTLPDGPFWTDAEYATVLFKNGEFGQVLHKPIRYGPNQGNSIQRWLQSRPVGTGYY